MRRRSAALTAGLLAGALAACAVTDQDRAVEVDGGRVPFDLLESETVPESTTTTAPETESVALCFLRDGRFDVREARLEPPVTMRDALRALASPPDDARSALPTANLVRAVRLNRGIATVDLSEDFASLGSNQQRLAVAQSVCTLTFRPGVGQVAFTLDRRAIDIPRADGSLSSRPVSSDDYQEMFG